MLHNLGQVAYGQVRGLVHVARGRRKLSADQLHYGGLAGAVLSHQTYLVAFADVEADVVQKVEIAEGKGKFVNRYHPEVVLGALQAR